MLVLFMVGGVIVFSPLDVPSYPPDKIRRMKMTSDEHYGVWYLHTKPARKLQRGFSVVSGAIPEFFLC